MVKIYPNSVYTVKPVYNDPIYSGHPLYYGHRTISKNVSVALYFLPSWPVYSGQPVYNGYLAIPQGWPLYTGLNILPLKTPFV